MLLTWLTHTDAAIRQYLSKMIKCVYYIPYWEKYVDHQAQTEQQKKMHIKSVDGFCSVNVEL